MWATIEAVATGTESVRLCAGCELYGEITPLLALTGEAVILLGALSECATCGSHFRCAYCGRYIPSDSARIWQHVAEKHGRAVDG